MWTVNSLCDLFQHGIKLEESLILPHKNTEGFVWHKNERFLLKYKWKNLIFFLILPRSFLAAQRAQKLLAEYHLSPHCQTHSNILSPRLISPWLDHSTLSLSEFTFFSLLQVYLFIIPRYHEPRYLGWYIWVQSWGFQCLQQAPYSVLKNQHIPGQADRGGSGELDW